MNKKGALELGINTVVILIIALVVIAGGIAFITGVFSQMKPIKIEMPNFPATSAEPLVLADGSPELKMGSKEYLDVNVYNKLGSDKEIEVVFGECRSAAENPGCTNLAPVIIALPQTIPSGESSAFRTLVKASCAGDASLKLQPGEYICSLKAVTTAKPAEVVAETQVIIKVTN